MTIQTNFPATKPSLLLDFAGTKQLDPRITFVRTTTATYYDISVSATAVKAEENLFYPSQDFSSGLWGKVGVAVTVNSVTAPDGTTTASTITEDSTNNPHLINQYSFSLGAGVYTMSLFAKLGSGSRFITFGFNRAFNAYVSATFDLSLGTNTQVLISTYTGGSATITSVGNGWYRCTVTATIDSSVDQRIALSSTSTHTSDSRGCKIYTGNGTAGAYIWGAQIEQRSAATPYTLTTTATVTNYAQAILRTAAAGVPRFDHNPVTRESLGLLVEEARTNLLVRSSEFDSVSWLKTRSSVTSNTIICPDGTLSGDKLIEDTTASNTHYIYANNVTISPNTSYTATVYLKAAERTFCAIELCDGAVGNNGGVVGVNLSTGTLGTPFIRGTASGVSASITSVGNSWYRISLTATVDASSTTADFVIYTATSLLTSGYPSYTGNGYSGIYIWGAQLEQGAFATSYIPTVASTVTRNADSVSMTGNNFTSWYNQGEGSFVVAAKIERTIASGQFPTIIRTFNGITGLEYFTCYGFLTGGNFNRAGAGLYAAGTTQFSLGSSSSSFDFTSNMNFSVGYKTNDSAASFAGASSVTDTNCVMSNGMDRLFIGVSSYNTSFLNGTIRKIAYYPVRLTNANLQALTS